MHPVDHDNIPIKHQRLPLQRLVQTAKLNGFLLLDSEWLGSNIPHHFQHIESGKIKEWTPRHIYHSGFPNDLRTDVDHLNNLRMFANENGFELLATAWMGATVKYRFYHKDSGKVCNWTPNQVLTHGFPKNHRAGRNYLSELRKLGTKNGFRLMSTKWLGAAKNHKFIHINSGDEYYGTPHNIKRQGFPNIAGQRYVTQEICRQILSHVFGGEFKTNNTRLAVVHGAPIELDGYQFFESLPAALSELSMLKKKTSVEIAFEFQGHNSHRLNKETIKRDRLKSKLCKNEGILLIHINPPDWKKVRNAEYIYTFVCNEIKNSLDRKIAFPEKFELNLSRWNPDVLRFDTLDKLSTKNGYLLMDTKWLGRFEKYNFKHVDSGVVRKWTADQILSSGFPKDIRTNDDRLMELSTLANAFGFELMESEWLGNRKQHCFIHKKSGKTYKWQPDQILNDGFPKYINEDFAKLDKIKLFSKNHGFDFLEMELLSSKTRHRFLHIESNKVYKWRIDQIFTAGFPKDLRTSENKFNALMQLSRDGGFKLLEHKWTGVKTKCRFMHLNTGVEYEWTPAQILSQGFPKKFNI